ncbi:hypothetical protein LJC69_05660, partial [Bacteroidales bacterium OttesenSCG-928-K22]|nr:hypothetical protein [Bacteroidales bacterium OttesenSCG-928-K22]
MNRNKKILLFSCIFLIISIFFVELFSYYTNTFDYTKNKVQNKIFSFETKSDVFAEQFFEYRDISIFSSLNDNDFNNQATILLYEDSALIYWSNNISNYPIFFSPQLENQIFETNNSINF